MTEEIKNENEVVGKVVGEVENKNKNSILTVRLGPEEKAMLNVLKGAPHWMNISEYIRATIRHLYESKTNKAGRAK